MVARSHFGTRVGGWRERRPDSVAWAARYDLWVRASGTFKVTTFAPTSLAPDPAIATALPVGVSTMEKHYEGAIAGRSATLFTAAFDPATGVGTYLAMESFEGSLDGRSGAFNFVHSASTSGADRTNEFFAIVTSSGTGTLAGISGTGGMRVESDGTHIVWFDYELS
jgi:hypothetical protein